VAIDERKFWLFDSYPEGEIYENLSWDLPGYRLQQKIGRPRRRRANRRNQP
jgi:hypothetical protein